MEELGDDGAGSVRETSGSTAAAGPSGSGAQSSTNDQLNRLIRNGAVFLEQHDVDLLRDTIGDWWEDDAKRGILAERLCAELKQSVSSSMRNDILGLLLEQSLVAKRYDEPTQAMQAIAILKSIMKCTPSRRSECYTKIMEYMQESELSVHRYALSKSIALWSKKKWMPSKSPETLAFTGKLIEIARLKLADATIKEKLKRDGPAFDRYVRYMQALINHAVFGNPEAGKQKVLQPLLESMKTCSTSAESLPDANTHILKATLVGMNSSAADMNGFINELLQIPANHKLVLLYETCFVALKSHFGSGKVNPASAADKLLELLTCAPSSSSSSSDEATLPVCRAMLQLARAFPQAMSEPVKQALERENLQQSEEYTLKQAAIAAAFSSSKRQELNELLNALLEPAKQQLQGLVTGAAAAGQGLFTDPDSLSCTIGSLTLVNEALRPSFTVAKHPMTDHLTWMLEVLLKLLHRLNSSLEQATGLKDVRAECYEMLSLCSTRLCDSFFTTSCSARFAGPLGVELNKSITSLESQQLMQLVRVVNSFIGSSEDNQPLYEWLRRIEVFQLISSCRSKLTNSELHSLTPEAAKLLSKEFMLRVEHAKDAQHKSLFSGILLDAISLFDKVVDQASVETWDSLFRLEAAKTAIRQGYAGMRSNLLDPEVKKKFAELAAKAASQLWSESKGVLSKFHEVRVAQLASFRSELWIANAAEDRVQLARLFLDIAANYSAMCFKLERDQEVIIVCNAELGYLVTKSQLEEEDEEDDEDEGDEGEVDGDDSDVYIHRLYQLCSPDIVQTEMLSIKGEFLSKHLVHGFQTAIASLLSTVQTAKMRILVIGFGAGAFSVFAHKVFNFRVTGVDLDGEVLSLAKKHFGVEPESMGIEFHRCEGVEFVSNTKLEAGAYDAIIVDVFGEPSEAPNLLDAPPKGFLEPSFFSNCKRLLQPTGAFIMNSSVTPKGNAGPEPPEAQDKGTKEPSIEAPAAGPEPEAGHEGESDNNESESDEEYEDHDAAKAAAIVGDALAEAGFGGPVYNIMHATNYCFLALASEEPEDKDALMKRGFDALELKIEEEEKGLKSKEADYNAKCLWGIRKGLEKMAIGQLHDKRRRI